jgi:hypothetical protein
MKSPRIYTYRVTFEEIPHWYWGVHKEKFFNDGYLGSPVTHRWMWDFYTPHLEICEEFPYTDEGWDQAHGVEKRLIFPDLNNPLCLNEQCGVQPSLAVCSKAGKIGGATTAKKLNLEKDEQGRSINAMKGAIARNAKKNEEGKSISGVNGAAVTHKGKSSDGKSIVAKKAGIRSHRERTPDGKSVRAIKWNQQKWKCLETGYITSPGPLTKYQRSRGIDTKLRIRVE